MPRCRFGIPQGRSRYVITAYDNWNLTEGDGVLDSVAYCITEEYVDLNSVESACLDAMGVRPYRGNEWFRSSLDHARQAIESVLNAAQLSYTEF